MAAIIEFDKLMSNGFVHRFLLLQDDDGIFTDIARGGPQAGEAGSVGLPSGGMKSGAGFGNLTTDVVPYYEGMPGAAANDFFDPAQLTQMPSRVVTSGTEQEMRQIFDDYAQTGARINAAEIPYGVAVDNSNATISTMRAESGQLTSRSVFTSILASEGGAFSPGYGQNLLEDGPGLGRVLGGIPSAGLLGYDVWQGYKTGDYSGLTSDSAVIGGFAINPVLGASILGIEQTLAPTPTQSKAVDERMSAEYKDRLIEEQQTAALKPFVVEIPAQTQDISSPDDPLAITIPAGRFVANPYFFGAGPDLLAPAQADGVSPYSSGLDIYSSLLAKPLQNDLTGAIDFNLITGNLNQPAPIVSSFPVLNTLIAPDQNSAGIQAALNYPSIDISVNTDAARLIQWCLIEKFYPRTSGRNARSFF